MREGGEGMLRFNKWKLSEGRSDVVQEEMEVKFDDESRVEHDFQRAIKCCGTRDGNLIVFATERVLLYKRMGMKNFAGSVINE